MQKFVIVGMRQNNYFGKPGKKVLQSFPDLTVWFIEGNLRDSLFRFNRFLHLEWVLRGYILLGVVWIRINYFYT
jgi:hypothetical protein